MPSSSRAALAGAVLAALGVALLRLLAFDVAPIHRADALTLHGFISLDRPSLHPLTSAVARVADPAPYGAIGLVLLSIALAQARVRVAAGVAIVLLGAAVTTDYILKPGLGHRHAEDIVFPSGHATASMALALCAILVASPQVRAYVALLGAAFAIAVSYSFLSLGWHYPSDVLGGYLVAAAWTSAVVATLRWANARWPERTGRRAAGRAFSRVQARTLTALVAGALLALVIAIAAVAPERALDFLRVHTTFAAGAAAIALAGLTVAGALTAILRD